MKTIHRDKINKLEDLPNVGVSIAEDLRTIGILTPEQLIDQNPFTMFQKLSNKTGKNHDLCLLDVFISIVEFMKGEDAKPWWAFTSIRKELLQKENIFKQSPSIKE